MSVKRKAHQTVCGWRGEGRIAFHISYPGQTALITLESNLCVHDSAELSKMERRGEEGKTEREEKKEI